MWWNQRRQHQSPWKAWPCLCLTHPGLSAAERWTPPGWSAHPRPCQTAAGERTDRRHVPLFICRLRDISNMARSEGGEESLQWSGLYGITSWSRYIKRTFDLMASKMAPCTPKTVTHCYLDIIQTLECCLCSSYWTSATECSAAISAREQAWVISFKSTAFPLFCC